MRLTRYEWKKTPEGGRARRLGCLWGLPTKFQNTKRWWNPRARTRHGGWAGTEWRWSMDHWETCSLKAVRHEGNPRLTEKLENWPQGSYRELTTVSSSKGNVVRSTENNQKVGQWRKSTKIVSGNHTEDLRFTKMVWHSQLLWWASISCTCVCAMRWLHARLDGQVFGTAGTSGGNLQKKRLNMLTETNTCKHPRLLVYQFIDGTDSRVFCAALCCGCFYKLHSSSYR